MNIARAYEYGTGHLPEPWEACSIMIARDAATAQSFVSVGAVSDILGLDPDRQVLQVQLAATGQAGWDLEPDQIRIINMPPKDDAPPRAGWRKPVCIDIRALGWWLAHVNARKVHNDYQMHLREFQHAVQIAADRLLWRTLSTGNVLPAPKLPSSHANCEHEGQCPHCGRWIQVGTTDGQSEWRRMS